MTIALHAHHIVIFATLAFSVAAVLPYWYTSPVGPYNQNVLSVCSSGTCYWTFTIQSTGSPTLQTILPFLVACLAVACFGISLIGIVLGSWYVQRLAGDKSSKCLLFLTNFCILLCFLCSGGIWSIMLSINKWQTIPFSINLGDFGFAFWIGLGSSIGYLYALILYVISLCKTC